MVAEVQSLVGWTPLLWAPGGHIMVEGVVSGCCSLHGDQEEERGVRGVQGRCSPPGHSPGLHGLQPHATCPQLPVGPFKPRWPGHSLQGLLLAPLNIPALMQELWRDISYPNHNNDESNEHTVPFLQAASLHPPWQSTATISSPPGISALGEARSVRAAHTAFLWHSGAGLY